MSEESPPVPLETLLRHRAWVRALALRLVTDPNTADDVEQQTWLEAMTHPPRDDTSARGWLSTVARNAARKLGRGATRRSKHEIAAPVHNPSRPTDELVAEADAGRRLVEFVLALDEPYRGTVLLRYFEGLETGEIAARTGVPAETVRTRLKRATAQLRERMDERHRGDRKAWAIALLGPGVFDRPWPGWGEGIVMGAGKKAAVAAAALIVVGGLTWTLTGGRGRDERVPPSTADAARSPRARDAGTASPARVEASRNAARAARSSDALTREASAPETLFHVRVIWPDGGPPGNAVYLVGTMEAWMMGERKFAFIQSTPQPVPASGTFDVTVAAGQIEPTVVRVSADGFVQVESTLSRPANGAAEDTVEVRLVAAPGGRLGGRVVVKGTDGCVEGAAIRVRLVDPKASPFQDTWAQNAPRPVVGPVVATANARGEFASTWLAPGTYDVQVIARGFEWWKGRVEVPSAELVAEISRTGGLGGRVRFADGAPASGVLVHASRTDVFRAETKTGPDGRFRFDDVPGGGIMVMICYSFDGSGANVRQQQLRGSSRAGDDLDIVAEPGLAISGAIVLADGRPFPGNPIARAIPEGPSLPSESNSAADDGTFTIRGLAPGRHRLEARLSRAPGSQAYRCEPISGMEAGAAGVRLVATFGLVIEGTVEIPPGAAELLEHVVVCSPDPRLRNTPTQYAPPIRLDRTGRFRFAGLDAGTWRIVFLTDFNLDSPWQPVPGTALVEAGDTAVRLTLSTSSTISGRVSFEGEPVGYCEVSVTAVGDANDTTTVLSYPQSMFTGQFCFSSLDPAKRWTLTARPKDLAPVRIDDVAVGAAPIDLVLTRGLTVKGRVLRADGSPLAIAYLQFIAANGGIDCTGFAGVKGEISTQPLPPGEYVVKVRPADSKTPHPGGYVEVGRVRAGDVNVELRLPK